MISQDQLLQALYTHRTGRILLRPFIRPWFSRLCGRFLDSRISALWAGRCIKRLQIPMEDYEDESYRSFNAFFTRRIRPEKRPFPTDTRLLASPCDGLATVIPLLEHTVLRVKDTPYTLESLLKSKKSAARFTDGTALILRLTVADYHRYCYPVSGRKTVNRHIDGKFHTVNPIANDYYPIYRENTREYTRLLSPWYGSILQMEVGALCVGRIINYDEKAVVFAGQEKGRFEFGGSTILLLFEKGRIRFREDLLLASAAGFETRVRLGEALGEPAL